MPLSVNSSEQLHRRVARLSETRVRARCSSRASRGGPAASCLPVTGAWYQVVVIGSY